MSIERAKVNIKEEAVLEKHDAGTGILREQITLINGEIIKHDFFDESGNIIEEGGN